MHMTHVGLPNSLYWQQLQDASLDAKHIETIAAHLQAQGLRRVLIFGANKGTGKGIREAVGDGFHGFVTSDTLDKDLAIDFDAVVIATSPRHYATIASRLEDIFAGREFTIVTVFDDDPDTVFDASNNVLEAVPCHSRDLFVRYSGDAFPCCKTWMHQHLKIGNI